MERVEGGITLVAEARVFRSSFIAAGKNTGEENVAQWALSAGVVDGEGVERAEHDRFADWPVAVGVSVGVVGISDSAVCGNGGVGVSVSEAAGRFFLLPRAVPSVETFNSMHVVQHTGRPEMQISAVAG